MQQKLLAPSGAQGVKISVRVVLVCLEHTIIIFLAQVKHFFLDIIECPICESEGLTLSTVILVQCCGSLLSLGGHTITGHIKGIPH